ncbi:hypothetical protein [Zavarzinella formosa]|uniref:hypothetical protein n=1 Tax=Zavarzinella formosa TaxID=360055 RepID=UPI0003788BFC|nr:hypothetical protein [Zavarzinella formosa]
MPLHVTFVDYTPAQLLAGGGTVGVQNDLISKALHGNLAFLTDGRRYIIQIDRRKQGPVEENTGKCRVQVEIRWLVAHPAEAEIGDIVPGNTLKPDMKPDNQDSYESTLKPGGQRFDPHGEGWERKL